MFEDFSVVSLKYLYAGCADFWFWRGATREHPPKRGCDRGATKPEPKSGATRRATCLFGSDFVVRSLQIPEGYARRSRLVLTQNPLPPLYSCFGDITVAQPTPFASTKVNWRVA